MGPVSPDIAAIEKQNAFAKLVHQEKRVTFQAEFLRLFVDAVLHRKIKQVEARALSN